MIPPRKERKRVERIDPKNPRSKEDKPWRHCTQIIIEPAEFPPHIKPAALIIGTKGSNHARLQDESGCCIQLRGIGISSPGTPGSNEPLHLFVKYDDISQLNKLNQALRQLIQTAFLRASGTADRPQPQQHQISSGPFVTQQHVKPTSPPSNPIECFYSIHLLLHSVPDLTTENLSEQYAAFYGWAIDARFSQLGGGSIARSLSMIPTLVSLTDCRTGLKLPTGRIADPAVVYTVSPIHPSSMTIAELKEIINQRPAAPATQVQAQPPTRPAPPPAQPEVAVPPQPILMQNPPPRVVQPKVRNAANETALQSAPPVLAPEELLMRGLHTLLQELHRPPPIGLSLDRNLGLPLAQLCDEFSKRTGIAMNAVALGHKNIME